MRTTAGSPTARWWYWSILLPLAALVGCSGGLTVAGGGGGLVPDTGGSGGTTDGAPGSVIFGRLVDSTDQPVAGAVVELRDGSNVRLAGPVTCDANGEFELEIEGDDLPGDAVLHILPPRLPQSHAPVMVTQGARVEVLVRLDEHGGAAVEAVLRAPESAQRLGNRPDDPLALGIDADGRSEAFQIKTRGRFGAGGVEVRLVYRVGSEAWQISPVSGRDEGERGLRLDLGDDASALHGRRLEVRAMAAPAGQIGAAHQFQRPQDLGREAVLSAEPVWVVPVLRRDDRVGRGGFGPGAVVALGGGGNALGVREDDLDALGLTDGATALLGSGDRWVEVRVQGRRDDLFELATLQLSDELATALGLDLRTRFAGYTLPLTSP